MQSQAILLLVEFFKISGSSVNLKKKELGGESSNHYEDRPIPLCTQDTI